MLLLTTTNDILQVTTSSSQSLDYTVSYVDIDTVSTPQVFLPGSGQGNIASAATTTILSAPAASTQRQVKQITLTNAGASANAVTVVKDISATEYKVFPTVTLAAGESLVYQDGGGWTYFAADGTEQTSRLAAGNTTEIQYNSSGVLSSSANLTYSSGTLGLAGTTAKINLTGVSSTPSAPSSGLMSVYTKSLAGLVYPHVMGPDGFAMPLQSSWFGRNIVYWYPSSSGTLGLGATWANVGSAGGTLPTTTNLYTASRRMTYTAATGANTQCSIRSDAMFFRGASANQGGFFFFCRFGLNTWTSGNRLLVGLTTATTAATTGNPSALTNLLAFIVDAGDTAITFGHNDAAGTAVKDTISGTTLATNQGYDAYIYCKPNDSTVYYRLDDLLTGTVLVDTSISSELPADTTMLIAHAAMGTGANSGAAAAVIGVNRIYVETVY